MWSMFPSTSSHFSPSISDILSPSTTASATGNSTLEPLAAVRMADTSPSDGMEISYLTRCGNRVRRCRSGRISASAAARSPWALRTVLGDLSLAIRLMERCTMSWSTSDTVTSIRSFRALTRRRRYPAMVEGESTESRLSMYRSMASPMVILDGLMAFVAPVFSSIIARLHSRLVGLVTEMRFPSTMTTAVQEPDGSFFGVGIFIDFSLQSDTMKGQMARESFCPFVRSRCWQHRGRIFYCVDCSIFRVSRYSTASGMSTNLTVALWFSSTVFLISSRSTRKNSFRGFALLTRFCSKC